MLHRDVSNTECEWTINETNLAIPVVDSLTRDESFVNNVLTENLNENSHINDSSLGPTLILGLDKNFFDHGDNAKDVIFIENSGLKFGTSEIKIDGSGSSNHKSFLAGGNYLISFVEPAKVVPWENGTLRSIRKIRQDAVDDDDDDTPTICDDKLSSIPDMRQDEETLFKSDEALALENTEAESSCGGFPMEKAIYNAQKMPGDLITSRSFVNWENDDKRNKEAFLSENNLPLKKKAKMKGPSSTMVVNSNEALVLSKEINRKQLLEEEGCPSKPISNYNSVDDVVKISTNGNKMKRRCCYSDSEASDTEEVDGQDWGVVSNYQSYQSCNDMVEDLREKNLVDDDFAKLVLTGMTEMKKDVLQELKSTSSESKPSYELLAFAFLLYFKRISAYRYLKKVFGLRWPATTQLKEWRKLVNSKPKRRKKAVNVM